MLAAGEKQLRRSGTLEGCGLWQMDTFSGAARLLVPFARLFQAAAAAGGGEGAPPAPPPDAAAGCLHAVSRPQVFPRLFMDNLQCLNQVFSTRLATMARAIDCVTLLHGAVICAASLPAGNPW